MDINDLARVRFLAIKTNGNCMEPLLPANAMILTSNDPMCRGRPALVILTDDAIGDRAYVRNVFYDGETYLRGEAPGHRRQEWRWPLDRIVQVRPVVLAYDAKHPPFLEESVVRVERALARPA